MRREGAGNPLLIAVMGPTASGKTDVAERLAEALDAQLVNADAFQVYRGMDIGTAKPSEPERYRLIDLKNPEESFGVGEYVLAAQQELESLYGEGRHVVVVGGTGLYVRALFEEYDTMGSLPPSDLRDALSEMELSELVERLKALSPDVAETVDLKNPVRVRRALERILAPSPSISWRLPPFRRIKLAIVPEPGDTDSRIARRVEGMLQREWVQEVRNLRDQGYSPHDPGFRAIGYRTLSRYLDGEVELNEATATTIAETRRYAKRQRSWLRSEPNLVRLDLDDAYADAMRRVEMTLTARS